MTIDEYIQLVNNIEEVSKIHERFLESLEQVSTLPQFDQKIGKLFLNKASYIRAVHLQYCASHPRAVNIIEKYKYVVHIIFYLSSNCLFIVMF